MSAGMGGLISLAKESSATGTVEADVSGFNGLSIDVDISATATYSIQWTNGGAWHDVVGLSGATADGEGAINVPVLKVRLNVTANSGNVNAYIKGVVAR